VLFLRNRVNTGMVIVNFQDLGPVLPYAPSRQELHEVLSGCHDLLQEYTWRELDAVIGDWELALTWASLDDHVNSEWYSRALVCVCLRGLRGEILPKFTVISPGDTKY